jgi:hypothetical protein
LNRNRLSISFNRLTTVVAAPKSFAYDGHTCAIFLAAVCDRRADATRTAGNGRLFPLMPTYDLLCFLRAIQRFADHRLGR